VLPVADGLLDLSRLLPTWRAFYRLAIAVVLSRVDALRVEQLEV
jgi:hypothetical protein